MQQSTPSFDPKKAEQFVRRTGEQVAAAMNCYVSSVGLQLGLYDTLNAMGAATSEEVASQAGLHERWVREWLRHQATNQQLEYDQDTDKFILSPEGAAVLCNSDHPFYFAAGYEAVMLMRKAADHLPSAFRTGLGMSYDDHGEGCACNIEKLNHYVPKYELVPNILPQLDGIVARLQEGINVSDVGCGAGFALIVMAKAFPQSHFTGYEISQHAIDRARRNVREAGLTNVNILDSREDPIPQDGSFSLMTTFDVVHDSPRPDRLISDIYGALAKDGTWLCSDIRSFPQFGDNLTDNPNAALMYGFSMLVCLSSAMSEPDGKGLGTLGFNIDVAQEMSAAAGFTRFRKLEYENAMNSYYEIRP